MIAVLRLATPSGTCRVCSRRQVPLWFKDGKACCGTCCVMGAVAPVAFGTESDRQTEARRREKTPTG